MRRARPETHNLALELLAREGGVGGDPEREVAAAERVFRKLGEPLSMLVGRAGFQSLLARAINLSAAESPLLRGIVGETLQEDSLQGLRPALPGADAAEVTEAMVNVVANLLWLLVTFIGRDLSMRLVREAWPGLGTGDSESGASEVDR